MVCIECFACPASEPRGKGGGEGGGGVRRRRERMARRRKGRQRRALTCGEKGRAGAADCPDALMRGLRGTGRARSPPPPGRADPAAATPAAPAATAAAITAGRRVESGAPLALVRSYTSTSPPPSRAPDRHPRRRGHGRQLPCWPCCRCCRRRQAGPRICCGAIWTGRPNRRETALRGAALVPAAAAESRRRAARSSAASPRRTPRSGNGTSAALDRAHVGETKRLLTLRLVRPWHREDGSGRWRARGATQRFGRRQVPGMGGGGPAQGTP